jgi:hypothetical protein
MSASLNNQLQGIEELDCVLDCWSQDDKREKSSYSLDELITLAEQRIEEFCEGGHMLNDALMGESGPEEKRYAQDQLRKARGWLKRAKAARAKQTA